MLNDINGAGLWAWIKWMAEDAGEWIEEKLGDGDGKHEWRDDYSDDTIKVDLWIFGIREKALN